MSAQDDIAAVRRLLERGFGEGHLWVVDEYVAPDFLEHVNGSQGVGPEAVKRIIIGLHASLSSVKLTVDDIAASGRDVWARSHLTAHNDKPIMGWPPTGSDVDLELIDVIRFKDGRMVEHWGVADRLGMLQQLGLMADPLERAA